MTFDTRYPTIILENSAKISYHCDANKSHLVVDTIDAEGVTLVSSWPLDLVVITNKDSCNSDGERGVFQITGCENCAGSKDMEVGPLIFHISPKEWRDVATTMKVAYLDAVFETGIRSSLKGSVILARIQHFWEDQLQLHQTVSGAVQQVASVGRLVASKNLLISKLQYLRQIASLASSLNYSGTVKAPANP